MDRELSPTVLNSLHSPADGLARAHWSSASAWFCSHQSDRACPIGGGLGSSENVEARTQGMHAAERK